ncbi:metabotropic glutamate receptor 2-like [Macrobrachium rosenbergii]|uniref:metabotropic glutamate receptor 2-like n=1 Tax=Macrobrachium rosenbergii TaxID=79674 RepID=UPI0034D58C73
MKISKMRWGAGVTLMVALAVTTNSGSASASDPDPLTLPGDVIIGIVGSVHEKSEESGGCGRIALRAVEELGAAEWALQTINNQSHQDYTIGLRVYDACGDEEMALRQTIRLLQETQSPSAPLLGVVGLGPGKVVSSVATPLHAFSTPILVTEARAAHTIPPADNVFTTAPHLTDQIQAALSAAVRIGGAGVAVNVVSSCAQATQVLEERAARGGMRILHILQLDKDAGNDNSKINNILPNQVTNFITNQVGYSGVIVMLVNVSELNVLSAELDSRVLRRTKIRWVLSTLGNPVDSEDLDVERMSKKFPGSLVVEAHSPVIPGFQKYFQHALFSNNSLLTPLAHSYRQSVLHCHTEGDNVLGSTRPCPKVIGTPSSASPLSAKDDASATATVKAVSSLAAAFRLVQIERCSTGVHCLEALRHDLHKDILEALLKLSFTVGGGSDRIRYTADGRLVNTFTIRRTTAEGLTQVGVYREDTGVVWNNPGEVWAVERTRWREGRTLPLMAMQETLNNDYQVEAVLLTHEDYVGRTWAFTVLVVASLGVISALYVCIYVALRVCDGTLNGPQVLGAVLLMGVMGVYSSCVVYVLPPSPITCALRQWAPPLCLALCYGVILVKCMHLRALVSLGLGGEVSQMNLHISLIFMVGVEGVLCMLGHAGGLGVGEEPLVILASDGSRLCGQKRVAILATRIYLILLLVFCLILSTLNRKIHRNHNEGRWLLLCSCVSCPIVGLWSVMSYLAPLSLDPPTTCVALLALASAILALVFIPKMKIIARQAKEFRHKHLAGTASVSTIFSHMEGSGPLGVASLKDCLKPVLTEESALALSHQDDTLDSSRSSVASQQSYRAAFHAAYGFPQPQEPLGTSPHHIMKNPIYDATPGAYP